MSSIQVVGVVEALIQNADTLFPGGEAPSCVHVPLGGPSAQLSALQTSFNPWEPHKLTTQPGGNCFSTLSLSVSSVKRR